MNRKRLKMNETVGIENRKGAVSVSGDEVTRKREVRWGVKGESGDGGGVVVEGTEGGGGGEVVEMDCVVGAAGCDDGVGNGDGFDKGEMGWVGEKRG